MKRGLDASDTFIHLYIHQMIREGILHKKKTLVFVRNANNGYHRLYIPTENLCTFHLYCIVLIAITHMDMHMEFCSTFNYYFHPMEEFLGSIKGAQLPMLATSVLYHVYFVLYSTKSLSSLARHVKFISIIFTLIANNNIISLFIIIIRIINILIIIINKDRNPMALLKHGKDLEMLQT